MHAEIIKESKKKGPEYSEPFLGLIEDGAI